MKWVNPADEPGLLGPLQGAADAASGVDLLTRWASVSRFAGLKTGPNSTGMPSVPVMVEIHSGASLAERTAIWNLIGTPDAYRRPGLLAPYVTGRVATDDLLSLVAQAGVVRWRLGADQRPRIQRGAPVQPVQHQALEALVSPPPLLGIIDHGIAFAHRAFRDAARPGTTRIRAFWDQEREAAAPTPPWTRPLDMGYGAMLDNAAINTLIARHGPREPALYRSLGYGPGACRFSHGTHVLDLAAGFPNPLRPEGAPSGPWDGYAGRAPIVAVQLPHLPFKDTSGCGLGVQVLDALHFIAGQASAGQTVVINLSDGAYGGPHDGQSMTELAIDDFLQRHPNVQLVLAAGNGADQRLHARTKQPLAMGQQCEIGWRVMPDDATDSFCEIWLDAAAALAAGSVVLHLQPPQGGPVVTVPLGGQAVLRDPDRICGMVVSTVNAVQRPGRAAFLLALGPTTRSASSWLGSAPHGNWRLRISNQAAGIDLRVHGYTERDNPVFNDKGPRRQSHLVEVPGGGMAVVRESTLSNLAGSAQAFVVGGRYWRGQGRCGSGLGTPTAVPCYVSQGPGRAPGAASTGHDAEAPCDETPLLRGLRAAGNRSGATVRMDGTSVAAPLVTRRLVNLAAAGTVDRAALKAALSGAPVLPGQEPP